MPYVITTYECAPGSAVDWEDPVTRHVVATLDSDPATLLRPLRGTMDGRAWVDLARAVRTLPERGGTIGPLPDGTVIEVLRVVWGWVVGVAEDHGAEIDEDATNAEIIDAYNQTCGTGGAS